MNPGAPPRTSKGPLGVTGQPLPGAPLLPSCQLVATRLHPSEVLDGLLSPCMPPPCPSGQTSRHGHPASTPGRPGQGPGTGQAPQRLCACSQGTEALGPKSRGLGRGSWPSFPSVGGQLSVGSCRGPACLGLFSPGSAGLADPPAQGWPRRGPGGGNTSSGRRRRHVAGQDPGPLGGLGSSDGICILVWVSGSSPGLPEMRRGRPRGASGWGRSAR